MQLWFQQKLWTLQGTTIYVFQLYLHYWKHNKTFINYCFANNFTITEGVMYFFFTVENITECLQDAKGVSYAGQINVTTNGSACARWDSALATKNGFSSLLDQENYCRNPNNEAKPWCFSVVTKAPEYCNISFCGSIGYSLCFPYLFDKYITRRSLVLSRSNSR